MEKDEILLDRLAQVEQEKIELQAKIRKIDNPLYKTRKLLGSISEGAIALTILFGLASCLVLWAAWGFGGWATDRFYLEFGRQKSCVVQEYDWGRDTDIYCNWVGDMKLLEYKFDEIQNTWIKLKDK